MGSNNDTNAKQRQPDTDAKQRQMLDIKVTLCYNVFVGGKSA